MHPMGPANPVGPHQRGFYEERASGFPSGPEGPMAWSQLKICNNCCTAALTTLNGFCHDHQLSRVPAGHPSAAVTWQDSCP